MACCVAAERLKQCRSLCNNCWHGFIIFCSSCSTVCVRERRGTCSAELHRGGYIMCRLSLMSLARLCGFDPSRAVKVSPAACTNKGVESRSMQIATKHMGANMLGYRKQTRVRKGSKRDLKSGKFKACSPSEPIQDTEDGGSG